MEQLWGMMGYVYRDLMSVVHFLPRGLMVGLPVGMLFWGVARGRNKKKDEAGALIAFCVYMAIIVIITFWSRESGSRKGIDLELFSTWGINQRNNAYVVENVLLFIPYGLIGGLAFPKMRNLFWCAVVGAMTSLCIESLQLVTERGYFQVDDILTNMLGTIVGWGLFWVARGIVRCFRRSDRSA